ncbi:hypothetical protein BDZ45DRAFT_190156 [Acephala macrosclerotiorum]|nr:hypothetical protein BDZ45DRAFT_190156 [Acephala macrosclerotiorum]
MSLRGPEELQRCDLLSLVSIGSTSSKETPLQRISHNPSPINRRAWSLQESLLSPRRLRYRSSEISWQCNESRACECGAGNKTIKEDETSCRFNRRPEALETLSLEQIDRRWDDVVEFFSERQLRVEGDRLPALSGLARKLADFYKAADPSGEAPEYLARMWKAPSWSSVSMEGPVSIVPLRGFRSCVEVVDAECVRSSADSYGEVKSGKLVVRGRVIHGVEARVKQREDGYNYRGFTHAKRFTVHGGRSRAF